MTSKFLRHHQFQQSRHWPCTIPPVLSMVLRLVPHSRRYIVFYTVLRNEERDALWIEQIQYCQWKETCLLKFPLRYFYYWRIDSTVSGAVAAILISFICTIHPILRASINKYLATIVSSQSTQFIKRTSKVFCYGPEKGEKEFGGGLVWWTKIDLVDWLIRAASIGALNENKTGPKPTDAKIWLILCALWNKGSIQSIIHRQGAVLILWHGTRN